MNAIRFHTSVCIIHEHNYIDPRSGVESQQSTELEHGVRSGSCGVSRGIVRSLKEGKDKVDEALAFS